jgi:UDPglucose 6-dehydrogenase
MLFDRISHYFNGQLAGRCIALWGLAFKPNTDDMREAPSRVLMEQLWAAGATVRAYDPIASTEARRIYGDQIGGDRPELVLCEGATEALKGADVLAVVTEWQEFRSPDFDSMSQILKHPVIFDGRNLYDPAMLHRAGFKYYAVGRGDSVSVVS